MLAIYTYICITPLIANQAPLLYKQANRTLDCGSWNVLQQALIANF